MLKNILNKKLQDIIVSGYSEKQENFYIFSPMLWWLYLKFDDAYLILFSNDSNITIEDSELINCYFDIEEGDLFTISSISKMDYGIISLIDLFYDDYENLIKIGINFLEASKYLLIDSVDFNGFIVEHQTREIAMRNHDSKKIITIT